MKDLRLTRGVARFFHTSRVDDRQVSLCERQTCVLSTTSVPARFLGDANIDEEVTAWELAYIQVLGFLGFEISNLFHLVIYLSNVWGW